jgi:hypothetical protein
MNDVPDWLWQGLSVWAVGKSLEWAWNHRKVIADKVSRTPEDIVINLQPLTLRAEAPPIRIAVTDKLDITDSVTSKVTSSLASRLGELASWYLHVS